MSRIAYLHIHQFQIGVHQKHERLQGQPLALLKGAHIFMCSKEASKNNVMPGMHVAEAKAICSTLILKERDDILYLHEQKQLAQDLSNCSPKISAYEFGEFSLDASGLLYSGGENKFCHSVLKFCAQKGFTTAYIGIADSTFAAMVAAYLKTRKLFIVKKGCDAEFLAPLSIKYLKLKPEIEESLLHLGIRSMGQLVNLPVTALVERFGQQVKLAHELAQGQDSRQPLLPEIPKQFACCLDMGGAILSLHETIFAVKSMLDKLTSALKHEGLWAEELALSFYNEDELFDERLLRLLHPSNQAKFLLEVIRLSLETNLLVREFTKIKLHVTRFSYELWQQNLIDLPTIASTDNNLSSQLVLLLQRLMIKIGEHKVVKAIASDHYEYNQAGVWTSVVKNRHPEKIIPINLDYLNNSAGRQTVSGLVLRKCTTTKVLVELNNSTPYAINYEKQWYRVKHITIPEFLSGHWWENYSARSYYKALVEPLYPKSKHSSKNNFLFLLLTHNHQNNSWFVEGLFD